MHGARSWRLWDPHFFAQLGMLLIALSPWLGLGSVAHAQDEAVVVGKIDDIEVFERVALGKGLRADWATAKLDLMTSKDLGIEILLSPLVPNAGDLAQEAEKSAKKILQVAAVTIGHEVVGSVSVERTDDIVKACETHLKSVSDTGGQNTILIVIGDDAQSCIEVAERPIFAFTRSAADLDIIDKDLSVRLGCASRLRASAGGKGKTALIAVIPALNEPDPYLLRFCLFDRSFSFFGFRGRILYDATEAREMVQSIRSAPKPELIPSTADLLMLAAIYKHLVGGEDYLAVRSKIEAWLPPLR